VIGIIISLILRYIIAVLELNVEYLVIPIIAVALIPFLLRRVIFYKRVKQKNVLLDSKDKRYRSYMMHVGSKLVFYSLSVAIFTKTSQIFLGLKSAYDLGIYTVAATGNKFLFCTGCSNLFFYDRYLSRKVIGRVSKESCSIKCIGHIY
jgi:hypothetical protein